VEDSAYSLLVVPYIRTWYVKCWQRINKDGVAAGCIGGGDDDPGHVHSKLTDSVNAFLVGANGLVANGGDEPSCQAITQVIEGDVDLGLRKVQRRRSRVH
jgi:hypothetical protein